MPEKQPSSIILNGQTVYAGKTFALGFVQHSVEEIIAFAKFIDPLPIHLDVEVAKKSIFGGLIAPGSMMYTDAHRKWFLPMFGPSIICGLGVRMWNFTKPHYPETPYHVFLTARELIFNPKRGTVQIEWYYEFKTENGMIVQDLELPVLHGWHGDGGE